MSAADHHTGSQVDSQTGIHGSDSVHLGENPETSDPTAAEHRCPAVTTRREFARAGLSAIGLVGVGGAAVLVSSRPGRAVTAAEWVVNGASIETASGSITAVTFGDADGVADDAVVVQYEGLNEPGRDLVLEVRVRGVDDGDPAGWTGGASTGWETLAAHTHTLPATNGTLNLSWEDAFEDDHPIDVTDHNGIDVGDFEVLAGEEERVRTLDVELFASIPGESISHSQTNQADVTVTATNDPPSIDQFETSQRPGGPAGIDVEWAVSAGDADLQDVVIQVYDGDDVVEESTDDVSGEQEADGDERFDDELEDGVEYEVVLTVTAEDGLSTSESQTQVAG